MEMGNKERRANMIVSMLPTVGMLGIRFKVVCFTKLPNFHFAMLPCPAHVMNCVYFGAGLGESMCVDENVQYISTEWKNILQANGMCVCVCVHVAKIGFPLAQ